MVGANYRNNLSAARDGPGA